MIPLSKIFIEIIAILVLSGIMGLTWFKSVGSLAGAWAFTVTFIILGVVAFLAWIGTCENANHQHWWDFDD